MPTDSSIGVVNEIKQGTSWGLRWRIYSSQPQMFLSLYWAFISVSKALKNMQFSYSPTSQKGIFCQYFPPGMKDTFTDKPLIPSEPVEPVLCGSMAIGAVSLAVAKTSALLGSNPLYVNIALLKHPQVGIRYIPSRGPMSVSVRRNHVSRFPCFRNSQQSQLYLR